MQQLLRPGSPLTPKRIAAGAGVIVLLVVGAFSLKSCSEDKTPPLTATLTFRDGTKSFGTVVRRSDTSVTVTLPTGDTHTYLFSELQNIDFAGDNGGDSSSSADSPTASTPAAGGAGTKSAAAVSGKSIQLPAGVSIPVRTNGILDSCCAPVGTMSLGIVDQPVKGSDGKVLIPADASVTILVREVKIADKRVQMQFELGSADFDGRHYLVNSAQGSLQPGAVVSFTGAELGSGDAKVHGLNIHLEDQALMGFRTATPTVFRFSD